MLTTVVVFVDIELVDRSKVKLVSAILSVVMYRKYCGFDGIAMEIDGLTVRYR